MRSTATRTAAAAIALAAFAAAPPAHADILDDILGITTAARDRATEARNNAASARDGATQARDNAASARDTAIELRDNMRSGLEMLTAQMQTAIADAVDELQTQIQDEYDGLDAFENGGQAEPFRQNLLRLIQNTSALLNALYDMAGLENSHVDFDPLTSVIAALPARSLYPMYRSTARESDLFHAGGIVDRMAEVLQDLLTVGPVFLEPECDEDAAILDQEVCDCGNLLPALPQLKRASTNLRRTAAGLKLIGKVLESAGETHLHKRAGFSGWAGVGIEENRKKKLGLLLASAGEAIQSANEFVHSRIQHCALVSIAADQRERDLEILTNQREILRLLRLQHASPRP